MPTTTIRGAKGSRQAVDLFGATDEAALEILGSSLDGDGKVHVLDSMFKASALRGVLRHAASRFMFDKATGEVLDLSTVVVIDIHGEVDGREASAVLAMSPAGWANVGAELVHCCHAEGLTIKVLTERHVRAALKAAS